MNRATKKLLEDLIDWVIADEHPEALDDDLSDIITDGDERENAKQIIIKEMENL